MPRPDSAVIKAANAISRLGADGLPNHESAVVTEFFDAVAEAQPAFVKPVLKRALHPRFLARLAPHLPDPTVKLGMSAMLGNTASPTVVRAGNKTNVIPGLAEVEIDGRILPGQTQEDFLRELQAVLGVPSGTHPDALDVGIGRFVADLVERQVLEVTPDA